MKDSTSGPIARRLELIRREEDPQVVARLASGWAVLGDRQPAALEGCCMLLPDPGAASVNDLDSPARSAFMTDLVRLGDAVLAATGAERINYLVLCNQVPELHGHVIPRFAAEAPAKRRAGPFEAYDFAGARTADGAGRDAALVERLRTTLVELR